MTTKPCFPELTQFRQELYQNFNNRADTLMELVDAICSNPHARSVVEYSLTPCFRRSYSTIFKALAEETWAEQKHLRTLAPHLPRPQDRPFWLLGVDVTPQPRPFAQTLHDRGMVYQPNAVAGNKPVTVGHAYSCVSLLPEPEAQVSSSWVVPLLMRRVATHEDKEIVGANQIATLLDDEQLPLAEAFCVDVGDTSYSKPAYLHTNRHHRNRVTLTRVRGTRTFYQQPVATDQEKSSGHPTWYGQPFSLKDASTWPEPAETLTLTETSRRGKTYRVQIQAWPNLLMRGQQKPERRTMHHHPFTLVRIVRYDEKGQLANKRPLWLLVMGTRRHELGLLQIYHAYKQRYNLEHFFRFGKQRLLLADFQTPETSREETWWRLVSLVYDQLWLARHLVQLLPRPWERHLLAMKTQQVSPSLVQRDFGRIIRQLGTPAKPPKPRGISPGRRKGTKLPPRPRPKVVVKGVPKANSP